MTCHACRAEPGYHALGLWAWLSRHLRLHRL